MGWVGWDVFFFFCGSIFLYVFELQVVVLCGELSVA